MVRPLIVAPKHDGYLLTGGAGGIGRAVIVRLAHAGAKRVILASRANASTSGDLLAIEARSCHCAHLACAVVLWAVRGVMHAAGMLRDGVASSLSVASFSAVCAPKVRAPAAPHSTRERTVDAKRTCYAGDGRLEPSAITP